jgi:hypothetical protein
MADYTSNEIQAAVEKVVKSSVRRQYGSLGNRDSETAFTDLQDAVAGVFMLYPSSPYYVVYLGTRRLMELIEIELETETSLLEAIENLNRNVVEIESLSSLENARVALQSLESAAASRARTFQSIEDIPAFKRYDSNLQRFIDDYGKNIRKNGEIAPTPQQSRQEIAGLISTLQAQHEEVLLYAYYLSVAIQDYDNMQLPAKVSAGVIGKSRQVLAQRIGELEERTPEQRLTGLRDTMLDLMAGRAAVRGLGSLTATTLYALIEGTGRVFADTDHLATPAGLLSDKAGPYAIFPGENELYFRMDDSFSFTGLLPSSFLANITTVPEPKDPATGNWGYVVDGSNDTLILDCYELTATTRVTTVFTAGTRSALEIRDWINTEFVSADVSLEALAVIKTPRYIGTASIVDTGGPAYWFQLPAGAGNWEDYGLLVDDVITVTSHTTPGVIGSWYRITTISGNQLYATMIDGVCGTDLACEIEAGTGRAVKIQITSADRKYALEGRVGFGFPYDTAQTALTMLGLIVRSEVYSRSTLAETIAQELTTSYNSQSNGQPRLLAEAVFEPILSLHGRSDPDIPARLSAYKLRQDASVTAGTNVTFTVPGAQEAGVVAGDKVVIKVTSTPADMNIMGTVSSADDTQILATMDQAISAGDVTIEAGPDIDLNDLLVVSGLSDSDAYLDFVISGSENQDGPYSMSRNGQQSIPFEFNLERSLPVNRAQGGLPQYFEVQLGLYKVRFSSTDTTLATKIQINDTPVGIGVPNNSAHILFFSGSAPYSAVGTTKYFLLPENPKNLELEDVLCLFETEPTIASSEHTIKGLQLSLLLVEVDPEIRTTLGTIAMSATTPIPFAKIRFHKKHNFSSMESEVASWLNRSQARMLWFSELYRLTNPLVANKNPTLYALSTAKNYVLGMDAALKDLYEIFDNYLVEPVTAVDTLINTYQERGATRGLDIILQGRFSDFFGLSMEGMSYSGRMRELIRDVSSKDLPVSSVGRENRMPTEMIEAEVEDLDYNYDFSDVENLDGGDLPGDYAELVTIGD